MIRGMRNRSPLFSWLLLLPACCWLALPAARADDPAAAPIEVKPDAYTQRDYRKQNAAWERRLFLDGFRAHGRAGHPWDDEAEAFIEQTQTFWAGEARDESEIETRKARSAELAERGRRMIEQGCDDPVVRYLAGRLAYQQNWNWQAPLFQYERAVRRLEEMPAYPRAIAVIAGRALRDIYEKGGHAERLKPLDEKIVAWLRQSVDDGSYTRDEDFLFVQRLVGPDGQGWFNQNDEAIAAWLPDAPLPDWARQTILGYTEVNRAWHIRGGSWARDVKQDAWKGFGEHMASASALLTQSWELRPDRPEAARLMMAVVAGDLRSVRLWFDRATAAQFDYEPAYGEMVWLSRPRWGGSHEAMLAFGRACLATRRFDTVVPGIYFRAIDDVASELDDWRTIYRNPDVADDVMDLSRGLVDEPTRRAEQGLRRSQWAANAWMCGRVDEAARQLAILQDAGGFRPAVSEKFRRFGTDQATFLSEVALLTGPAREEYLLAEALDAAAQVGAASAAYEEVLKKVGAADPAGYLPGRRLRTLALERQLAGGDWVKMDPGANLSDWRQVLGKWTAPDGGLQNQGTSGTSLVVMPARVGPDFEVRGHFEADAKAGGAALGVVFGYAEHTHEGGPWHACECWQDGGSPAASATLFDSGHWIKAPKVPVQLEGTNTFLVRCWQGRVSYSLNDKPVLENVALAQDRDAVREATGPLLGFTVHDSHPGISTRISNIEVRRLLPPPVVTEK